MAWRIIVCALVGYLFGCLNGAIVISRLTQHEDVREKGSGNAGLTNFLRNYGGMVTLLVMLLDVGKVVAACLLGKLIWSDEPELAKMLAGVCAMAGHIFPVFFGFRGGKGILSGAAVAAMMDWRVFAILISIFLIAFLLTRYVSLGSILAASCFPVAFGIFFPKEPWIWIMAAVIGALAVFMHRGNIQRLLRGTERKTYLHKSKNKEDAK